MSLTMAKKLVMERKKRESRELSLAELKLRPKNVKNVENLEAVPYPTAVRLPDPELNFLVEAGRFRYDRSFLLQFMSVCKERPESLAPLEALGLEPYNANAENSGARASSHRVGSTVMNNDLPPRRQEPSSSSQSRPPASNAIRHSAPFPRGTSGRPMFVPRSASRGGVRGGSPRQDRRTRSQHGNNRSKSTGPSELQTPASQATGLHSVSQLETSENPSVGTDALRIQRRQRPRVHRLAIVGRKIRALLNKLSTKKFDSITDKIVVWVNRSEVEKDGILLVRIVRLVIEHAKDGAAFSEMYARLCRKIMEQISLNVQDETFLDSDGQPLAGGVLFRKYLLNGCQYEFERGWISKEITTAVASETTDVHATETLSQASGRPAPDSDGYYAAKAKRQGLGLVRFLCELFKLQILKERAMHACVITLLNIINPTEEEIANLNEIFANIGQSLDSPKAKKHMDVFIELNLEIIRCSGLILLKDIIELRERQWQARPQPAPSIVTPLGLDEQDVSDLGIIDGEGSIRNRLNVTLGASIVPGMTFAIPSERIRVRIENKFAGYLAKQNIDKTLLSLKGLSPEYQYILIDKLVSRAIESGGKAVTLVEQLFSAAHKQAIVSSRAFEQGLLPTIVMADDWSLDVPKTYQWLARFIQAAGISKPSADAMANKILVLGEHRISPRDQLMKEVENASLVMA
ncbi:unnamed protein product [Rhizoctonia solani]|nr:unnamed protein product [Rhizoctonia solani]